MFNIDVQNLLISLLLVWVFFFSRKIGPAIRDMLRGGPRPPSHPLPADDSRILNRRRERPSPGV
jgi:hypothetical protein